MTGARATPGFGRGLRPQREAWSRGPRLGAPASSLRARPCGAPLRAGGARDDQEIDLVWTVARRAAGAPGGLAAGPSPAPAPPGPRPGPGRAPLRRRRADGGRGDGGRGGLRPPLGRWAPVAPSRSLALTWPWWPSAGASTPWAVLAPTAGPRRPSSSTLPPRTAGSPGRRCRSPLQLRRPGRASHPRPAPPAPLRARSPAPGVGQGPADAHLAPRPRPGRPGGQIVRRGGCSEDPQRDLPTVEVFDPLV